MRRFSRQLRGGAGWPAGAGILAILVANPALAGWREWLGREPKPVEDSSIFANVDPLSLVLIIILMTLAGWALRRPENIRRGIAEGFGRALGSLVGWSLASVAIAGVGAIAGMVALGSFTFATAAICFVGTLIVCAAVYLLVVLNP